MHKKMTVKCLVPSARYYYAREVFGGVAHVYVPQTPDPHDSHSLPHENGNPSCAHTGTEGSSVNYSTPRILSFLSSRCYWQASDSKTLTAMNMFSRYNNISQLERSRSISLAQFPIFENPGLFPKLLSEALKL